MQPKIIDDPFVYRALFQKTQEIPPTDSSEPALPLPGNLFLRPGLYRFRSKKYLLSQEGLYRFIMPPHDNQQRVVYSGGLEPFLSSLSWILVHGLADNDKNYAQALEKALTSKLSVTCNHSALFAVFSLKSLGFKARIVRGLTLETWNTYNNLHVAFEVFRKGLNKWVFYDLDFKAFLSKDQVPLSLWEIVENLRAGNELEVNFAFGGTKIDTANFRFDDSGFDSVFLGEYASSHIGLLNTYRRLMQVPIIHDNDHMCYCDQGDNNQMVKTYIPQAVCLSKDDFLNRFYPQSKSGA